MAPGAVRVNPPPCQPGVRQQLDWGLALAPTKYQKVNEKFQIPSEVYVNTGRTYEKDGYVPKWRAIRSDHGRIMVAICANMHLGDAWEWADSPQYPEKFSGLAFRIVLNYITYAMTH